MKKVLFLIPTLAHGGAEKVLVNLANNLDKKKYDVTVHVMFDGGANKEFLKSHIHYKYMFKKIFRGSAILFSMIKPELLYKHLVKEQYDIVVSYLEGATARIACGCKSKKVSWIHIEMLDEKAFTLGFKSKQEALKYYNSFDRNVCVSNTVKEKFCDFGVNQDKTIVLYNTNEDQEIKDKSEESVDDVVFNKNVINMVSVGKLVPSKGYDRLLRIHNKLIKEGFAIHTYILGIGEYEEEFRKFIKENDLEDSFTLLGYKKNPYKYVKNCDLYVCSSRREGFSTAVTESLIVGTPVISTECSGAVELLGEHDEYGVVVGTNEEALYEGIKDLLSNKEKIQYYHEKAMERALFFKKETRVREVEEMFEEL